MSKFKAGDRVRKVRDISFHEQCVPTGALGVYNNGYIRRDGDGAACDEVNDWELINLTNNKTIMTKVSNMMKRLLDLDTQKLVKAGFLNGGLDLTTEGQNALNTINFIANKAGLVTLADEKIAEEKKNA